MNAVKCDPTHRIRLPRLRPGDWFVPEYVSEDEVKLRRVPDPTQPRRMSREECLDALARSPLRFSSGFDQLKGETR